MAAFLLAAGLARATQPDPGWWDQRPAGGDPVITPDSPDHHAAATIGQAKWMAKRALDQIGKINQPLAAAIRAKLTASPAIVDFTVPATPTAAWLAEQRAPLLIGQLKALAAPFYEEIDAGSDTVLAAEMTLYGTRDASDPDNIYPWVGGTTAGNHAIASIGQLKACFALRLDRNMPLPIADTDVDGMDDAWETLHGLDPNSSADATADADGDGIPNRIEYFLGFDPNNTSSNGTDPDSSRDRDGDGMPDAYEASQGNVVIYNANPLFTPRINRRFFQAPLDWELADGGGDQDGDGVSNHQEYIHGTRYNLADTDGDEIDDGTEITNGTNPLVMNLPAQLQGLVDALESLDSRISGKDPATTMKLYSNTTAKWTSNVFVWNDDNWLDDVKDQLDGFHMYVSDWDQSYGLMPITPRHVLSCGHNGPDVPSPPHKIRYVNPEDPTMVFETDIIARINDYPGKFSSDTKQPLEEDLSVYLLADPLPSWVNIAPIFPTLGAYDLRILERRNVPTVCISQGNRPTSDPYVASWPAAQTPDNRKAHVRGIASTAVPEANSLRTSFHHDFTPGDSGTPRYLLVDDVLYLYKVTYGGDGSGVTVSDHIGYINSLITRANTAASFTPPTPAPGQPDPYLVTPAPMPTF